MAEFMFQNVVYRATVYRTGFLPRPGRKEWNGRYQSEVVAEVLLSNLYTVGEELLPKMEDFDPSLI